MAIAMQSNVADDPLTTVAVVPFDLVPARTSRGAPASSSSSSSLAAAASNLISAIAQGTASLETAETRSEADSDEGSSSFTYTAPASTVTGIEQQGWYTSTPYHISNRYYDADITLRATKAALPIAGANEGQKVESVLSQTYPAYVAVVDRSQSLEHHRSLAASLETKVAAGFDADISIVAGVSLISSSNSQVVTVLDDDIGSSCRRPEASQSTTRAKTSDLVALYADHGWEFIAIDELDGDVSDREDQEDGYSDTSREDDKDGIERIREALMNHMWNGLVRKDSAAPSASRTAPSRGSAAFPTSFGSSSFSDAKEDRSEMDDTDEGEADGADALDGPAADGLPNGARLATALPALDADEHADASDLDEQLAKLFLASTSNAGSADFAKLEAFLESEDPSWPGPAPDTTPGAKPTFEDDFDDFLPFQSASSTAAPSEPLSSADADDLPSKHDISEMQDRLFGANAAARLEAGPLGMGNQPKGSGDGDLASQLSQLQWHAQRVRNIRDPDQRRKEAALVALAFSMQWSEGEDGTAADAGAMSF